MSYTSFDMEEARKTLTLCFVRRRPRILLGMKKRGFGAGRFNGFGGKVEPGEGVEEAAKRELLEEAGLRADSLEKAGILEFRFSDKPGEALEVHVFETNDAAGEPSESEEMRPQWFEESDIPYHAMWPDDIFWLPLALAGKKFRGAVLFGAGDAVLEHDIHEVETL